MGETADQAQTKVLVNWKNAEETLKDAETWGKVCGVWECPTVAPEGADGGDQSQGDDAWLHSQINKIYKFSA